MDIISRHLVGIASCALAAALCSSATAAQGIAEHEFNLPRQDLARSLHEVALRSGRSLIAPSELLAGRRAAPLVGRFTTALAVELLLSGTGLTASEVGEAFVIKTSVGRLPFGSAVGEPPSGDSDEIVLTGTRLRGVRPAGSSPHIIDREGIERSGYSTAQQLLQSLPQAFGGGPTESTSGLSARSNASLNSSYGSGINLRGLGSSSTLVLLNGRRPALGGFSGVFADLSLVPLSAVARIEILADGASALYGSDAVAGVVNIIPRASFEGLEATVRAGTADGDFSEIQLGVIGGGRWNAGRLMLAYEYHHRGRLPASGHPFATEDLRPFGGPDYRLAYANPGTIIAGGRTFAIPVGQDGSGLRADQLIADELNRDDGWKGTDLLPRQTRHAAYAHAEQEVGERLTLWADLLASERRFHSRVRPTSLAPRTVPVTNPFYVDPLGTARPVRVQYDFREDLGQETRSGRVRGLAAATGAIAELGPWAAEVHASYGTQKERNTVGNLVNSARLNRALADTDPATAYNLFGDGSSTNRATIDAVRGSSTSSLHHRLWSVAGKADGPLLRLPGGSARVAIGGEYREEAAAGQNVSDSASLTPVERIFELPGERRITAAFAELLLPLVSEANSIPGIERLDVTLAGRTERYSDVGTTTNPKLGLSWRPMQAITLRATYGTSFRAPSFADLQQGPTNSLYFAFPLPDPHSTTGTTNALVLRGNDPDLRPEKARIWTAGFDFTPAFVPGLNASATFFRIHYRDRITDPSAELFSFLANKQVYASLITASPSPALVASYYASPSFVDFAGIPQSDVELLIDARTQNLAIVNQAGIDFDLACRRSGRIGAIEAGLSGTVLTSLRQALTRDAPAVDLLDTIGNPPSLKLRGRVGWSSGIHSVAAHLNHIGGYQNSTSDVAERVSEWTTVDLQWSANLAPLGRRGGFRIALSISNLFDRPPPYARNYNGISAVGYDPENASPVGRLISVQAVRTW